jgi:hypothetical protein
MIIDLLQFLQVVGQIINDYRLSGGRKHPAGGENRRWSVDQFCLLEKSNSSVVLEAM